MLTETLLLVSFGRCFVGIDVGTTGKIRRRLNLLHLTLTARELLVGGAYDSTLVLALVIRLYCVTVSVLGDKVPVFLLGDALREDLIR